ncbi:hypothetical protein [Acaryochloris sp. 'Moss Beach']|uniref:hypothetical protein n=1 Tax=Acaryochloris sp. 'Moss Beach' TaxID=2740837 RepID=UPI001F3062E1|nr:hypothetical protein [Acaryochloris sp. 'Moss Beach']
MSPASIQPRDPALPEALSLIQQRDAYLNSIYPPDSHHQMSKAVLMQTHIQFLNVGKKHR